MAEIVLKFNSSPPGQIGRHFGRRYFDYIFLNENVEIPIEISLKYVPRSLIDSSGKGLAPNRRQAISWTDDDPVHRRKTTKNEEREVSRIFDMPCRAP